MRILLVDDDRELLDLLNFVLRREGYQVITAQDDATARRQFSHEQPHIVILDINLGDESGFDFLRYLRQQSNIPVVILSARGREEDKVLGLDLGADDYLTKPFSHRELVARVRANLRRLEVDQPAQRTVMSKLEVGPITMNLAEHVVTVGGDSIDLTVTEFRVLHHLMVNAGNVVSTRALLKHVWGEDDATRGDVVRVTVHRLRRKLGDDPTQPRFLHTVPGVGVMIKSISA